MMRGYFDRMMRPLRRPAPVINWTPVTLTEADLAFISERRFSIDELRRQYQTAKPAADGKIG